MKKHQVTREDQSWRSRRECDRTTSDVAGRSDEQAIDKVLEERRRAEYLRLHDDDEAELEQPRG
jgi:hypothetical protein